MDNKVVDILVCPECGGKLTLQGSELMCFACRLAYAIEDNIPVMLSEHARTLSAEEDPRHG